MSDFNLFRAIDHGFSLPLTYFRRYRLASWPEFLADFVRHWPTDGDHVYVNLVRDGMPNTRGAVSPPGAIAVFAG